MVENILDIVWHGCFPRMVLSGTSVILVSGFKGTFWESSRGKFKMLNESWPMAQEYVDTLGDVVNLKGNSISMSKSILALFQTRSCMDLIWVVEHLQKLSKQVDNFDVYS
jgi:hypothetical protein